MADRNVEPAPGSPPRRRPWQRPSWGRKVITVAWTKATGKDAAPTHPEDPQVGLREALGWSMLTGVIVESARLLATRAAARRTHSGPDGEPANAADG